jgi:Bacterial extracellular solute-binding protein
MPASKLFLLSLVVFWGAAVVALGAVAVSADEDLASIVYDCDLPGLQDFTPGQYQGIVANYLSHQTERSSPHFPVRAAEFEACTGGKILFSESYSIWDDPIADLGTKTTPGSEIYDGYLMSNSHFPELSQLGLLEHLNDRIRKDNAKLKWEDVMPKVRTMSQYHKNGVSNIDFLPYDGDFIVPIIRLDLLEEFDIPMPNTWDELVDIAKFFHGKDINDDGEQDFGLCHYP